MAKTARRLAVLASLAVTFAACSDTSGPTSPVASYALTSVATHALPAVMYEEEGYTLEVTAGVGDLAAGGTYTFSTTVIETVDGNKSTYVEPDAGTWVQEADGAIRFTSSTGDVFMGAWSGTTLTVTLFDVVYVYTMDD